MGMEITAPRRIMEPTSTPSMLAAVVGPGVGGTRQWVSCKPAAIARARPTMDLPDTREMAFARGAKMTTAESAKTGMEMNQPVMARAHSSFFLPTARMKE